MTSTPAVHPSRPRTTMLTPARRRRPAPTPSLPIRTLGIAAIAIIVLASIVTANAASSITRSYNLRTGWNAVHLDVRPTDPTAESVLAGLPIDSVWRHQTRLTSVDFIQDPSEPVWNEDQWLVHIPTNRLESLDNNLFQIQGGFSYLIKLTAPATWSVTGEPVVNPTPWKADAFNLRGFPIDASAPPTFRDFFKFSPAHFQPSSGVLQPVYRLDPDGRWTLVNPTDTMQEGAAYWVYTAGPSDYVAPFEARTRGIDGLQFGSALEEVELTLVNLAGGPVTATVAESGGPSPSALSLGVLNPPDGLRWIPLPSLHVEALAASESRTLRVGISRQSFTGDSYDTLLDIRDNLGTRFLIPVHATPTLPPPTSSPSGRSLLNARSNRRGTAAPGPSTSPAAGLWVGTASVNAVSEAHSGPLRTNLMSSSLTDPSGSPQPLQIVRELGSPAPTPVRNEFDLRVLIHVAADGRAVLLREVIQLWRDGTYETNSAGEQVVKTPGSYVLLTDPTRIAEFRGAGLRDGTPVGRRLSTSSFDFLATPTNNFLALDGEFSPNQTLRGDYTLFPDQPTHPFKHKYHPDHDNLDPTFRNRVEEAFEISRAFEFQFLPADPGTGARPVPDYGRTEIAGLYRETVSGLHQVPIHAEGVFRLRRVSTVDELNPPAIP